jgi:hypothetical protein
MMAVVGNVKYCEAISKNNAKIAMLLLSLIDMKID